MDAEQAACMCNRALGGVGGKRDLPTTIHVANASALAPSIGNHHKRHHNILCIPAIKARTNLYWCTLTSNVLILTDPFKEHPEVISSCHSALESLRALEVPSSLPF
eukprot:4688163-Amphidinium_carterae.1